MALHQAELAGQSEEAADIQSWIKLRELLRAKRPEAALTELEAWLADQESLAPPTTPSSALPTTAAEVRLALLNPTLADHLRALTEVRRWQQPAEAQAALAGALSHPLTRAEAHNLLGVLAAEVGQTEQAATEFAAALAADPQHYRALTNRAGLAAERQDYAAAEADLHRALQLEPRHHAAHQNLAVVLRQQGKRAESVRAQKKAQSLDRRQVDQRGRDEARRTVSGLNRLPRSVWIALALLLFFALFWMWGGSGPAA